MAGNRRTRSNEPCSFSEAIEAVRAGEGGENTTLAQAYLASEEAAEVGKTLSGWLRGGRGRPVSPPCSDLPLLP